MQIKQRTPQEVFRKWVKALRSGKYDQIQGQLREVDGEYNFDTDEFKATNVVGFCCLGVLCDLAVKDGGPKWDSNDSLFNSEDGEPPRVLLDYLGLTDDMVQELINMNDSHGASFDEIADEIESNIMPALGMN